MFRRSYLFICTVFLVALMVKGFTFNREKLSENPKLPKRFDLRDENHVPNVKEQAWGTCWAFATALSLESQILKKGLLRSEFPNDVVELNPYYLDKYSGFSQKGDDDHVKKSWHSGQGSRFPGSNSDDPNNGLIVHLGGDYQMAAAFLTNNRGAIPQHQSPRIPRKGDHQLFGDLKNEGILWKNNYRYYFPTHIHWLSLNSNENEIRQRVKESILTNGAVASSEYMSEEPVGFAKDGTPIFVNLTSKNEVNHAINIIGWDDHITLGPHKGAWIIQDSDHRTKEDQPLGHYYLLYDDIYAAKHPLMGAISFEDVIRTPFKEAYSHSLHGFRYSTTSLDDIQMVANQFTAKKNHIIKGVGFYTLGKNVEYKVEISSSLDGPVLASLEGNEDIPGFHYLDFSSQNISWKKDKNITIKLALNDKQYAYDASFTMPVLLGGKELPSWGQAMDVHSAAQMNQGFFLTVKNKWKDFSTFVSPNNGQSIHKHAAKNPTANLAITLYVD